MIRCIMNYTINNRILHLSSEKYDSLIVLDDMTSELKNPQLLRLNTIINNRRHLRTSVFTLVQVYNSIPLSNRKTINYLIMYKLKNKKEIKPIYAEMITGMSYS